MKRTSTILSVLVAGVVVATAAAAKEPKEPAGKAPALAKGPTIEIAFVLDTTGSMGGLIAAAKEKIWQIANQIASGKPRPDVFMALVPYRDKGDTYVTKVYPLTSNLDQVYTDLMTFEANGGGDTPEHVNQAISDAIHKIQWSEGKRVTRIIYLVGDSPPHNEYKDAPTYDKLARAAMDKGIYINTILCGNNSETGEVWREIARRAEGNFIQIAQDGATRTVDTPYDAELAELNRKLVATTIIYGDAVTQANQKKLNEAAAAKPAEPGSAESLSLMRKAADRADFSVKSGKAASNDLVSDLALGKVKLKDVKDADLPENMRKMTAAQREAYVAEQQQARDKLTKEIAALSAQRAEHLKKEAAKAATAAPSFDAEVLGSLKRQAERGGVKYSE